ncbi:MAG: NGG1p interacting factor NIF3 [Minisyncoccales bacterium]
MKTREIFHLALEMGKDADFRGKEKVQEVLKRKRKKYESLSKKEKEFFDLEALENPYLDSRIYHVAEDKEIKKILVGIDITIEELLLAKELNGIDLVISHHPVGKGLAFLVDVMELQCDVLNYYGVPINIAEKLMKVRIEEVSRGLHPINHERVVDGARLLGINFMNVHTPADNLAAHFLKKMIEEKKPERIEDLMDLLLEIPENYQAAKMNSGPKIFVGSKENRCGKIALTEITGGTEGSPKLYERISLCGIGTIVGMHVSEEHRKEAEAAHLNVVIAGHISSDSLGMNLFLDEIEKRGIEIISCSGLIRVKRI